MPKGTRGFVALGVLGLSLLNALTRAIKGIWLSRVKDGSKLLQGWQWHYK